MITDQTQNADATARQEQRLSSDQRRWQRLAFDPTRLMLPPAFRRRWGPSLLQRPFYIQEDLAATVEADLLAIFDLIVSLPERLFDGDAWRYCRALGLPEDAVQVLAPITAAHPPERYGRADLYFNGSSFRLLEFNIAADLGGTEHSILNHALLAQPEFAAHATAHRLSFIDTGLHLANAVKAAAGQVSQRNPASCALVCAPARKVPDQLLLDSLSEMLMAHDLDVQVCEPSELASRNRRILAGGRPVDLVFRYFNLEDLLPTPPPWWMMLADAQSAGNLAIWTGPQSAAYSNKMVLPLLWDAACKGLLGDDEADLVKRLMPMSLRLHSDALAPTTSQKLIEWARANRDQLVLKRIWSFGGHGIHLGWELSESEWARALHEAGSDYLLQARVDPAPEELEIDGRIETWIPVHGFFVAPSGPAGDYIRAVPHAERTVINFDSNSATRTGTSFRYPPRLRGPQERGRG